MKTRDQSQPMDLSDIEMIPNVTFMTVAESQAMFERKVRAVLDISSREFVRRWTAGEYRPVPDDTEGRKIARLSMMIPFAQDVDH